MDRKRIAWQLERTAMGDGYYGEALRAAKELPEATPSVRALLDCEGACVTTVFEEQT